MKLTGSQIVCESLLKEGVEVFFGYPGGAVIPFYDTLPQYPKLRHILTRHEQGAAMAAEGYARIKGEVGVCVATFGPGATNLVTGIANAYLDSVPVVAITGQVASHLLGTDAFQEVDTTGITQPITKHNYLVTNIKDLTQVIKEAFYIARSGRPGPVLIDIPVDVFNAECEYEYPNKVELVGFKPKMSGNPKQIKEVGKYLFQANKPVIIAGHGVNISGAYNELSKFVEKTNIPITNTLLGLSNFKQDHELYCGMLGMHGTATANYAVHDSDLIIAIGIRFDDRITGKVSEFAKNKKFIHIDIDPAEIGKNIKIDLPIVGDVKEVMTEINKTLDKKFEYKEWFDQIQKWKEEHPMKKFAQLQINDYERLYCESCDRIGFFEGVEDCKTSQSSLSVGQPHKTPQPPLSGGLQDTPLIRGARGVEDNNLEIKTKIDNFEHESKTSLKSKSKDKPPCMRNLFAPQVIEILSKQTDGQAIISSDVGKNQMWVAQYYEFKKQNSLLSSGGLGSMGFGLPSAMGAKIAYPDQEVWAVVGDGGFQMNIQELGTLMAYGINVKIALLNNAYLGMVRQWQDLFYKKNFVDVYMHNPDFIKIAQAYDMKAYRACNEKEADEAIKNARVENGPVLVEFVINPIKNIYPMVPAGIVLKEQLLGN